MGSDRQIIADQILRAIDYGKLPKDEIERRLEQIIDTELNVPLDAEINKVKVDLCNSLLMKLYLQGKIDDKVDIEESKKGVERRVDSYRRRRNILWTAVRSIAAALILVVGLFALNIIPPIRWFTGTSTDDEQQYIVQGHVINTQNIASAISEHNGSGSITSNNIEDIERFLNFTLNLPKELGYGFIATEYHARVSVNRINIICLYKNESQDSVRYRMIMYQDINDAYIQFEQEKQGDKRMIDGKDVYIFQNINTIDYIWTNEGMVFLLECDLNVDNSLEIFSRLIGGSQ